MNKYQKEIHLIRVSYIILISLFVLLGAFYVIFGKSIKTREDKPTSTEKITIVETMEETTEELATTRTYRYFLSDYERSVVESVVMAEAGGECYDGQMAVAQCILNASEQSNLAPSDAVIKYHYTKRRPEPTEKVKKAVSAVFDDGETITDEPIMYFYAPDIVYSAWHESQIYVTTIGGHRFFAEK